MSERTGWRAALALLLLMAGTGLWAWARTPIGQRVATHFNAQGVADDWSSPAFAFGFAPLLGAGILALFRVVMRLDPRRENVAASARPVAVIAFFTVLIMAVVHGTVIALAMGRQLDIESLLCFTIGLLLAATGNMMPKLRSNNFFGIRTPWTLSDDQVWEHTHRFAGWVFVVCGLLLMAAAFVPALPGQRAPLLAVLPLLAGVAPAVKSWLLWRQRHPR
jgi:uncharacterized membrane protein